jgi:uncharacterized membrane protein
MERGGDGFEGFDEGAPDFNPDQQALFPVGSQVSAEYTGPIPPPSMLGDYGRVQEDFPERIVAMAEVQVHGRHKLMQKGVDAESFAVRLSSITTAVVAVGGLGASVFLIIEGLPVASLLTAIPAVLMGSAQVINGIRRKNPE